MNLSSLIFCYLLLKSSKSPVTICKVTHTGKSASFGLKATCKILAGVFLKETCSLMLVNIIKGPGPSIIQSAPKQLGVCCERLILGPFRLINHDCEPNAQVRRGARLLFLRQIYSSFRSFRFPTHMLVWLRQ